MYRITSTTRFGKTIVTTISILLIASIPLTASAKDTQKDEWILHQRQYGSGPHTVYLTADSIRIVQELIGFELVSKAPEWKVVLFRRKEKIFCPLSLEQAFRVQNFSPPMQRSSAKKLLPENHATINGVKLIKFDDHSGGIWIIDGINIAPQAKNLLLAFYHARPVDGVVYRSYSVLDEDTRRRNARTFKTNLQFEPKVADIVTTLSVGKVKFNPADFEYPTNFKPASVQQITTSSQQRKQYESLLEDMKVGEKFGK